MLAPGDEQAVFASGSDVSYVPELRCKPKVPPRAVGNARRLLLSPSGMAVIQWAVISGQWAVIKDKAGGVDQGERANRGRNREQG